MYKSHVSKQGTIWRWSSVWYSSQVETHANTQTLGKIVLRHSVSLLVWIVLDLALCNYESKACSKQQLHTLTRQRWFKSTATFKFSEPHSFSNVWRRDATAYVVYIHISKLPKSLPPKSTGSTATFWEDRVQRQSIERTAVGQGEIFPCAMAPGNLSLFFGCRDSSVTKSCRISTSSLKGSKDLPRVPSSFNYKREKNNFSKEKWC